MSFDKNFVGTKYLNFEVAENELTRDWFYEFISPYYSIGEPGNDTDTFSISMISEFGEGSKFSSKKPAGIYVRFAYLDTEKRLFCLRRVVCSVASKPELGKIAFEINQTSSQAQVVELWHPVYFKLCDLRKACEENAGLINLCFDVKYAAYDSSRQVSTVSSGNRRSQLIGLIDSEILSRMNAFAISGEYADATLKIRDREYRAHRVVLASCSEVFHAMFQTDMQEKETGLIKLGDELRDEVVKAFLQYVYTGQVDNLPELVHELYALAHFYDTKGLLDLCETCLCESCVDERNVVKTLLLAEKYSLKRLVREAKDYIKANLALLVKQTIFVEYLTERLSLSNAAKNLILSDDHKMKDFKERVVAYIAQNLQHLVKDDKYKALYKTHPNLILEVDEYLAKHAILPRQPDEKVDD